MCSFLSVYLRGASVILLLTVSQAQDYDFTPPPDYDSDYNATFEYSLYSNTSTEDLDKLSERFIGRDKEKDTSSRGPTEGGGINVSNASLPVSLEMWTFVWTLMILICLNLQQLQRTL